MWMWERGAESQRVGISIWIAIALFYAVAVAVAAAPVEASRAVSSTENVKTTTTTTETRAGAETSKARPSSTMSVLPTTSSVIPLAETSATTKSDARARKLTLSKVATLSSLPVSKQTTKQVETTTKVETTTASSSTAIVYSSVATTTARDSTTTTSTVDGNIGSTALLSTTGVAISTTTVATSSSSAEFITATTEVQSTVTRSNSRLPIATLTVSVPPVGPPLSSNLPISSLPGDRPRPSNGPEGVPLPSEAPRPSQTSVPSDAPRPSDAPQPSQTSVPSEAPQPSDAPQPSRSPVPSEAPQPSDSPQPPVSSEDPPVESESSPLPAPTVPPSPPAAPPTVSIPFSAPIPTIPPQPTVGPAPPQGPGGAAPPTLPPSLPQGSFTRPPVPPPQAPVKVVVPPADQPIQIAEAPADQPPAQKEPQPGRITPVLPAPSPRPNPTVPGGQPGVNRGGNAPNGSPGDNAPRTGDASDLSNGGGSPSKTPMVVGSTLGVAFVLIGGLAYGYRMRKKSQDGQSRGLDGDFSRSIPPPLDGSMAPGAGPGVFAAINFEGIRTSFDQSSWSGSAAGTPPREVNRSQATPTPKLAAMERGLGDMPYLGAPAMAKAAERPESDNQLYSIISEVKPVQIQTVPVATPVVESTTPALAGPLPGALVAPPPLGTLPHNYYLNRDSFMTETTEVSQDRPLSSDCESEATIQPHTTYHKLAPHSSLIDFINKDPGEATMQRVNAAAAIVAAAATKVASEESGSIRSPASLDRPRNPYTFSAASDSYYTTASYDSFRDSFATETTDGTSLSIFDTLKTVRDDDHLGSNLQVGSISGSFADEVAGAYKKAFRRTYESQGSVESDGEPVLGRLGVGPGSITGSSNMD